MRTVTVALAAGLSLLSAPICAQDFNIGDVFSGIGRALNPEEEQERADRGQRFEDYDRTYEEEEERGEDYSYDARYDPEEDRFWSEEAARLDYERMSPEEQRRYDEMSEEERRRYEEDAGYERREWYEERASADARESYDEALRDMEEEIWQERRRR